MVSGEARPHDSAPDLETSTPLAVKSYCSGLPFDGKRLVGPTRNPSHAAPTFFHYMESGGSEAPSTTGPPPTPTHRHTQVVEESPTSACDFPGPLAADPPPRAGAQGTATAAVKTGCPNCECACWCPFCDCACWCPYCECACGCPYRECACGCPFCEGAFDDDEGSWERECDRGLVGAGAQERGDY